MTSTPNTEAVVYYDGFCPLCVASMRKLARLDRHGALALESFRHATDFSRHGIRVEHLEREMHVVEANGAIHRGFAALQAIARIVPTLRPLRPFLAIAAAVGIGDRLYRWFAARRIIVSDSRHCTVECTM